MLELRLLNRVPKQAAPLAYVSAKTMTVAENASLVDYSRDRIANSLEYYKTVDVIDFAVRSASSNYQVFSDDFVVGNRAVLSANVPEGASLFYRYHLGGWASILLVSDTGTVTLTVTSTTLVIGGIYTYTYTGKSVRAIVKEINDQSANGVLAFTLHPGTSGFKTGSYSITTAGITIKNASYSRVYAPNASTTDLSAARESIKRLAQVLCDSQKSNELQWDIVVDSYDENGFLCSLYTDHRGIDGKTFQVRFPAITQAGALQNNKTEVINPLPYLLDGFDYSVSRGSEAWQIDDVATTATMGLGVFGVSDIVVNTTEVQITTADTSASVDYVGKSLNQIAAELQSSFSDLSFTVLADKPILAIGDLASISTSSVLEGTALLLTQQLSVLFGPDSRIHPLLPYDEESLKPWYPRIHYGRFSEENYVTDVGYGDSYGDYYGGSARLRYIFGVPEYSNQTWNNLLGEPYRSISLEIPVVVSDKILRTRRFPLESLGSITMKDGERNITSYISDVDLEQGFIFFSTSIDNFGSITIDYVYEERALVYTQVDLNTLNNPDLVGKFIGIYVIPEDVGAGSFSAARTVYHVIRDTAESIVSDLAALTFSNTWMVRPLLIGIYQVIPTLDRTEVLFTDAFREGGGVADDISPQGEARFIEGAGRWDGDPFEADSAIILEVPRALFPTSSSSLPFTLDPEKLSGFMDPSGLFTREEVAKAARKWIPPGTFVIVEEKS